MTILREIIITQFDCKKIAGFNKKDDEQDTRIDDHVHIIGPKQY